MIVAIIGGFGLIDMLLSSSVKFGDSSAPLGFVAAGIIFLKILVLNAYLVCNLIGAKAFIKNATKIPIISIIMTTIAIGLVVISVIV